MRCDVGRARSSCECVSVCVRVLVCGHTRSRLCRSLIPTTERNMDARRAADGPACVRVSLFSLHAAVRSWNWGLLRMAERVHTKKTDPHRLSREGCRSKALDAEMKIDVPLVQIRRHLHGQTVLHVARCRKNACTFY